MDEERIEVPSEVIEENTPFIPEPVTAPGRPQQSEEDAKLDKIADIFVTIVLTLGQLIIAAILITLGLTTIPIFKFTFFTILKVFCLLIGIKFLVAGYQEKKL